MGHLPEPDPLMTETGSLTYEPARQPQGEAMTDREDWLVAAQKEVDRAARLNERRCSFCGQAATVAREVGVTSRYADGYDSERVALERPDPIRGRLTVNADSCDEHDLALSWAMMDATGAGAVGGQLLVPVDAAGIREEWVADITETAAYRYAYDALVSMPRDKEKP